MRSRMDDLGRDLSEALERAERESRRNRFLSDLGTSIEFDELLDRVLDAVLEVPGFDAAMVSLDEHGGGTAASATRGMKFALIGRSMISPFGLAMRPRIPASWRIWLNDPRAQIGRAHV